MNKRPFFVFKQRNLAYEPLTASVPEPIDIPVPKKVTLLCNKPFDPFEQQTPMLLKEGDEVTTGQKLAVYEDPDAYVISTITGRISAVAAYTDDVGNDLTAVSVNASESESPDTQFEEHAKALSLDTAGSFLAHLPGAPVFDAFFDSEKTIQTIVIAGADQDLWVDTNQYVVKSRMDDLKQGIEMLKQITGVNQMIVAVPADLISGFGSIGADIKAISTKYPSAFPRLIMKELLGKIVPAEKTPEDLGVCFFSAEAVAAIGHAFTGARLPVAKLLTVIDKDGAKSMVSARIGTPIADIFKACNITVNDGDRMIVGGPMTGSAVFSEDHPVQPNMDAIIVQDAANLAAVSDYPCINCGECVRICPAKIQVNMLVRFLEAGEFETAADQYDLHSCIECGLCSFVCVANMPVFQYIRLAKNELARINVAEAI